MALPEYPAIVLSLQKVVASSAKLKEEVLHYDILSPWSCVKSVIAKVCHHSAGLLAGANVVVGMGNATYHL